MVVGREAQNAGIGTSASRCPIVPFEVSSAMLLRLMLTL